MSLFPDELLARSSRTARWGVVVSISFVVMACGGSAEPEATAAVASSTTTLHIEADNLPEDVAQVMAQPVFHIAPVLPEPPGDDDALDANQSATFTPSFKAVPQEFRSVSTRRLMPYMLDGTPPNAASSVFNGLGEVVEPLASAAGVTTYSVAQVRAAYGFSALPAVGAKPVGLQAAQLGAGQTIYIVDARHNPNVAAELAAFNQKFGLPTCTSRVLPSATPLPLATASQSAGCELVVAYSSPAGGIAASAPAYDAGWATEIALDVQWAHAMAPLARIVLIESPDASLNNLLAAIRLANSMGSGVVSMSFGAQEGTWTDSVDSIFSVPGMTYLAATGDSGASVNWPSVSPNVIAVGGTTLTYNGAGARSEVSWTGTGGGTSAYTPAPVYQKAALPVVGSVVRRTVADVAMNADPSTGQYVAVMSPGSSAVQWITAGGTSLSSPMWAGLVAVTNASRLQASRTLLGGAHSLLYGQIGAVSGNYANAFLDIRLGSHGSCGTCSAKVGYDQLSGLGTPNATAFVSLLSGASAPPQAPVVTPASISGTVGTALTFTAAVIAPNPVTFSLSSAPSGMAVSAAGIVSWPTPLAGSYAVTVVAKDTITGLTGQGVYNLNVAAPVAPMVQGASIAGRPGVPLSFKAGVTSANPVTYTLTGAPAGMVVGSDGVVSWPSPVIGAFNMALTAKDTKTGLSGKGDFTVKIAAAGPVISASAMVGVAGKPLSGSISISSPGASYLSVSIAGVPLGMGFSVAGTTITANWPSPVTGSYQLLVTAKDSAGLSAQLAVPVTITAK
ncbi:S53 family peptidase [Acidovorax sp.]|uniref:S53 family peptidase n=1 Tax=Acidovorax sp. TaxID=1872122 RepID=UPI003D005CDD